MAAPAALLGVLGAFPPALAPDGGFLKLPLAHAQCCFTPETPVLMADGTQRPISGVHPGDRVIGRRGQVNRVTGVHAVPLGSRALYGINQHRPFFTAAHPFLTPGGWRALDYAATRRETPGLAVAELAAGDVLVTATVVSGETSGALALSPAVSFGRVVLQRLDEGAEVPAGEVFSLMLDGDHSYIANGFVVHNAGGGQGGGGQGGGQGGGGQGQGGGQGNSGQGGSGHGPGGVGQGKGGVAAGSNGPVSSTSTVSSVPVTGNTVPAGDAAVGNLSASDTPPANDAAPSGTEAAAPAPGEAAVENPAAPGDSAKASEFSGNANPAGPDIGKTEEKDLISHGWQ